MKHLFLFFSLQCAVALSQVSTIDSLELIINAPENDSVLCHAIFSKGRIMEKSNPTEALALYERSLHLAQNNEFQQLEVLSLNYLGVLCYNIGADDQACAYYKAVIERTNQYNDFFDVNCKSLSNLGLIYHKNEEYEQEYLCYKKAIQQIKEKEISLSLAAFYHNIAHIHISQLQLDSALFYFDLTHDINHQTLLEIAESDTISVLQRKNDFAYTLSGVAEVYQKRKEYDIAFNFLKAALNLRHDVGYKSEIAKTHNQIGILLREQNKASLALKYFRESGINAEKLQLHDEITVYARNQYEIYKSWNKPDSALKYHEIYFGAVEKIKQKETEHALTEFAFLNDLEKIERAYNEQALTSKIIRIEEKKREKFLRYSLLGILILIIGFLIFLYNRFRIIRSQKNVIKEKKVEIEIAYSDLNAEKLKVEKKNKVITDSLNYAKRIQDAILPENQLIQSFFNHFFAFYLPKDIVGGDFYWYRCYDDLAIIASVDCTGHGVPGGFMSMMGSLLLDKIVKAEQLNTAKILEELNEEIIRVLKQNSGGEIQDGMDISLCLVDKKNKKMHFSGARNGILVIQNGVFNRLQADLLPVGGNYSSKSKKLKRTYETQIISLNNADWVFMYSDGFHDQLGGEHFTSLGMEQFENMLKEIIEEPNGACMQLQNHFDNWKRNMIQLDDVLVLGFQL